MAAKPEKPAKSAKAKKARTVSLQDLAAATKASVQAAVGKDLLHSIKPGLLTGLVLDREQLATLARTPIELAKEIAKGVGAATGVAVTPGVQRANDAVLVGYLVSRTGRK